MNISCLSSEATLQPPPSQLWLRLFLHAESICGMTTQRHWNLLCWQSCSDPLSNFSTDCHLKSTPVGIRPTCLATERSPISACSASLSHARSAPHASRKLAAAHLLPDLRSSGGVVDVGIGLVVELVGQEVVRVGSHQRLGVSSQAWEALGRRRQVYLWRGQPAGRWLRGLTAVRLVRAISPSH